MSNRSTKLAKAVSDSVRSEEGYKTIRVPYKNTNYENNTVSTELKAQVSAEVWTKLLVLTANVKATADANEQARIKRANRAAKHARRRASKRTS
jgi:hypothetical protein